MEFGFELDVGAGGEGFDEVLVGDVERGEAGVGDAEAVVGEGGRGVAGLLFEGASDGAACGRR